MLAARTFAATCCRNITLFRHLQHWASVGHKQDLVSPSGFREKLFAGYDKDKLVWMYSETFQASEMARAEAEKASVEAALAIMVARMEAQKASAVARAESEKARAEAEKASALACAEAEKASALACAEAEKASAVARAEAEKASAVARAEAERASAVAEKASAEARAEAEKASAVARAEVEKARAEAEKASAVTRAEAEKASAVVRAVRAEARAEVMELQIRLASAMRSAGVLDARSFLEYIKRQSLSKSVSNTTAWTKVLRENPHLVKCLLASIQSWQKDCKKSPDPVHRVLAGKIATIYGGLNNSIHSFVEKAGLVIYEGVPDEPTSSALICIAKQFGVPYEVKVPISKVHKAAGTSDEE